MKKIILLIILISTFWFSCEKDLKITDFEDDFGNYEPELKVEAILRPDNPKESIIRMYSTISVTDISILNGIDDDGDGDIDEYDEILDKIQDSTATVKITDLSNGIVYDFEYVDSADSFFTYTETEIFDYTESIVYYKGYKLKQTDSEISLGYMTNYRIDIDSKLFDKEITGETTTYPCVEFIDTLYTFDQDTIIMNIKDEKEIFWKSNLEVSAYVVSLEEYIPGIGFVNLYSYRMSRDNDFLDKYPNYSIGRNFLFGLEEGYFMFTVEALNPDYGKYLFSQLPLNDPQRTNLRDKSGSPVMGSFGSITSKSIIVKIVK